MAHIRQSRPDSGVGVQVKVLENFQVTSSSLKSGPMVDATCEEATLFRGSRGETGNPFQSRANMAYKRQRQDFGLCFQVKDLQICAVVPCSLASGPVVEQLLHRNVQRFRGGLVLKAHRLLFHSTLGLKEDDRTGR